jgi:tight adherence protein C
VLLRGASDPVQVVAVLVLLGLAGWLGPDLLAANMAARRLLAIGRGLPDAIDLLVICAESGLSLDVALARSARELAPAQPALAAELQATAVELGFLPHRADAFANLGKRVPLAQVAALGDMLVQTERFGTPLAQALRVMAAEYRTGRLLKAEEKAARLPALMTVPMIAFILPPLFVVLIGPAVIGALAK